MGDSGLRETPPECLDCPDKTECLRAGMSRPGGIGVREATFILLLEPLGMEGVALAAVLQFRIVTILGDIVFFVTTFFVPAGKVCECR